MMLYTATIPVYKRVLLNLDAILSKAEAWAQERKIHEGVVLNARLALDMFPLVRQIQMVCDNAKGTAARLAGKEPIRMEDNESTFAELHVRIQKTLDILESVTPSEFEGAEERKIVMPYHQNRTLSAENYVWEYALPNFFFHVTTAYAILRHHGVPLGKGDYLGGLSLCE
jgi:uncharacterized protein